MYRGSTKASVFYRSSECAGFPHVLLSTGFSEFTRFTIDSFVLDDEMQHADGAASILFLFLS